MALFQHVTRRLANEVLAVLRQFPELRLDQPIIVGVSGGADSLALLRALSSLRTSVRPPIVIAHFSHGMRPSADKREASLVRRVAAEVEAVFVNGGPPTGEKLTSEASARLARYRFFQSVVNGHGASCVAVAHTMNDQAETVLLRLTRGSGLHGLAAMRELSALPVEDGTLTVFRPLLRVTREETTAVCAEAGWTPASDGSNRQLRFARNRVRRRVIPELRALNPSVVEALAAFAESACADESYLVEAAYEAITGAESRTEKQVAWSKDALKALPHALFARVLMSAAEHVGSPSGLSSKGVTAARKLVHAPGGGELALSGQLRFVVEQDSCLLTRVPHGPAPDAAGGEEAFLTIPGEVRFGRWWVEARVGAVTPGEEEGSWRIVFDADKVGAPLTVRSRKPGDRIEAAGMQGDVRLQDLLVNARIPRAQRDELPLIVGNHGIAWVPGVRAAAWALAKETTTSPLTLAVRRVNS